jgi:hypothetical protein
MKLFIAVLTSLFCVLNAYAEQKPDKNTLAKRMGAAIAVEAHYINLFKDLKQYLVQAEEMGWVTKAEREELESFIVKQGVPLDTQMPAAKVAGRKVIWDDVSVEIQTDGTIKTQTGHILRPSGKERFTDAFKQAYAALMNKPVAVWSWIEPEAAAGPVTRAVSATGAALSTAAGWTAWGAMYAAMTVGGPTIGVGLCSWTVMPLDYAKYWLQWIIFHGSVDCKDGAYRLLNYPWYLKTVGQDFMDAYRAKDFPGFGPSKGLMNSLCYSPVFDLLGEGYLGLSNRSAERKNWEQASNKDIWENNIAKRIPNSTLEKALGPDGDFYKCTPENSDKVEAFLKKEARAELTKLLASFKGKGAGQTETPSTAK